jgi:hypothetical protein
MRMKKKRNYNPQYRINLVKVFNRSYGSESREVRDRLRGSLSNPQFRRQFSKAVIDRIVERTLTGVDKSGAEFKEYSSSYKASDTFQIYGKSSHVNLELTGEMLSSLKGVTKMQEVVIELIGKNNKAKAHGHINGIKSKKYGKVKRDFFGLPEEDLDAIMLESIEAFRSESYDEVSQIYAGQSFDQAFGQVGSQSEFNTQLSVQDVLAALIRNLNG